MNLRIAKDSVRIRYEEREAEELTRSGAISETIPLPDSPMVIETKIVEGIETPATFSFGNRHTTINIRRDDFTTLTSDRSRRDSAINVELNGGLELVIEIDLFSREKKKH